MSENGNHGNNDGEVIIDVKNLHKNYGPTEVIKGVDLTAVSYTNLTLPTSDLV